MCWPVLLILKDHCFTLSYTCIFNILFSFTENIFIKVFTKNCENIWFPLVKSKQDMVYNDSTMICELTTTPNFFFCFLKKETTNVWIVIKKSNLLSVYLTLINTYISDIVFQWINLYTVKWFILQFWCLLWMDDFEID